MKIDIFTVGGTIDKVYFDAKSEYEVGEPLVHKILHAHQVNIAYAVTKLMAKDSLEMTDDDRDSIYHAVEKAGSHIVITHGTDTMVATAKRLSALTTKTIVLTGALSPALFKDSDAAFNIGCAIAAVQSAKPGVYIAMNGCVFAYGSVKKDVANNRFVAV